MSSPKLKEALRSCIINFDRQVLVTDLLQEYALSYGEVNKTLEEYLKAQETQGMEYEKSFLVRGAEENMNEICAVVKGDRKCKEFLRKLKDAEALLYSVELKGGACSAAEELKPITHCSVKLKCLERRTTGKPQNNNANGELNNKATLSSSTSTVKTETKPIIGKGVLPSVGGKPSNQIESKNSTRQEKEATTEAKKPRLETAGDAADTQKSTLKEEKKSSPEEQKLDKKSKVKPIQAKKGGINSFFAPATKKTDTKDGKAIVNPPSPKKMQDFFKKSVKQQPQQQQQQVPTKPEAIPISKQEGEDIAALLSSSAESSDEEEKLEALQRDIITSDGEDATGGYKRRRIVESDDDEDDAQQAKQEKIENREETMKEQQHEDNQVEEKPQSETFMDEEGYIVTIKPKKGYQAARKANSPPKARAENSSLPAAKPAQPKTKQAKLTFFTKK